MGDVQQILSAIGVPTAAIVTAWCLKRAGDVVDDDPAVRPEWTAGASRFLLNRSWPASPKPYQLISKVFDRFLGKTHLSWRCLMRCALVTVIFISVCNIIFLPQIIRDENMAQEIVAGMRHVDKPFADRASLYKYHLVGSLYWLPFAIFADYLSLWKTRVTLAATRALLDDRRRLPSVPLGLVLVVLDILYSLMISIGITYVALAVTRLVIHAGGPSIVLQRGISVLLTGDPEQSFVSHDAAGYVGEHFVSLIGGDVGDGFGIFLLSTCFPALWIAVMLMAVVVLSVIPFLQRSTMVVFDVESHPFRAIGNVSALLVLFAGLVWCVVRAVL